MTKKELSQIYYLRRELAELERRLSKLQEASKSTTQTITGMPFAETGSDKTSLGADIADIKTEIALHKHRITEEYSKLQAYVSSVDDSLIRQILTYRFIDGNSWRKVAYRVGGCNTEESVRKVCYRYINRKL